jgi:glycogen debranching enzyme
MGKRSLPLFVVLGNAAAVAAQAVALHPIAGLNAATTGLSIERRVQAGQPFTVAGPQGVLLGQQEGTFEAWVLPVKLLSHFTLRAQVDGYPVPIELNPDAASIRVYPDRTVITYTHIALTVRQTMFAPEHSPDGTGAVVLFEIDAVKPVDLTFSFTPEMKPMWPKASPGSVSSEWDAKVGTYLVHTDYSDFTAAITIPTAQPGIMAPYQEKPQTHPLELKLHYDPKRDAGKAYPLLMAVGQTAETASSAALAKKLSDLNESLPALYASHAAKFDKLLANLTSIETPDREFNDAFRWAEVSIEQLRATTNPGGETGLVAGYFSSGDSSRPGFGWFFGRDTLYTLYAVNGMGDFALTREALDFLLRRQRDDGKIMHEYSQTAGTIDWKSLPYMYAAADATPLFLTAMLDYVQASGDVGYLRTHREAVEKAWQFETSHDSDNDGVYDNSQGTGWVESWPGGQPHQEIYLALLDQQASTAMSKLAALLGDQATSATAAARATKLTSTIESEYYLPATGEYAFSRNADGSLDKAATVYPSLAWWSAGTKGLAHADKSLRRWDSHDFSTDWGARDVAETESFFDSMSYHQGSVWPLFTGWASLADYRSGRNLSGYAHLMQNADQTTTQDLGAVTELLSGAFFVPFGRSTSHQLWSSAMVITPAMRGMFGITVDAAAGKVDVDPRLPAEWASAQVKNLHVGESVCLVEYRREGGRMGVRATTLSGPRVKVGSGVAGARIVGDVVQVPLAAVEVGISHGLPEPGSRTRQMKVLAQEYQGRSLKLELEGEGGSTARMVVRRNEAKGTLAATGGTLSGAGADGLMRLEVSFPAGAGYQGRTVVLSW